MPASPATANARRLAYLPAYSAGVRAGLKEIGPKLIGLGPTDLGVLAQRPKISVSARASGWDMISPRDLARQP